VGAGNGKSKGKRKTPDKFVMDFSGGCQI